MRSERLPDLGAVGHIAGEPQAAHGPGCCRSRFAIQVEHGHRRALRGERHGRGEPDAAAGAGHHGHLAGEGLGHRALELGLLQAPVLHVEQVGFAQRLVAADGLGVGDDADGVLGEIRGNRRILGRGADAEQADTWDKDHARAGIELGLHPAHARVLALEHGIVARHVGRHRLPHRFGEVVEPARLGRRHDQREILGPYDVVGCHHAALGVVREIRAIHVVADVGVGAEVEHEPLRLVAGLGRLHRHRAAQDRRHVRRRSVGGIRPLASAAEIRSQRWR